MFVETLLSRLGGLFETRAVVTEAAFTLSAVVTVEVSFFTRKSGVDSLVGLRSTIGREVEEFSEVLETRVGESVIEVAPTDKTENTIVYQE